MTKARDIADIGSSATRLDTVGSNFIINGDMKIFQRATAATAVANNYTTADRWKAWNDSTYGGAMTTERSTDVPSGQGFSYSLKLQCSTASTSTAAAEYAQFNQAIEAQNCQAFAYGTSGAKTLTLSFWCKSNKTGVYTVAFRKPDSTTYIIPIEYTISSADTWEKKTITVSPTAGSTTLITNSGGAIANDNGSGLEVFWNLLLGSNYTGGTSGTWSSNANHYSTTNAVNWLDNTANNFYITGVQLQIGDTSTDFEVEDYGTTLAKCQRYLNKWTVDASGGSYNFFAMGYSYQSTNANIVSQLPQNMRASPSFSHSGNFRLCSNGCVNVTGIALSRANTRTPTIVPEVSSGLTAGDAYGLGDNNDVNAYIQFDAEL